MKKHVHVIVFMLGFAGFLTACQCKTCTKSGENDVRVCRDNYETEEDYNDALGVYQLGGYSCN
jgi:hypothetical protein